MSGKTKSLIGYGVLIVVSALLLTRLLHYRALYEALAENLVLPAEGAPAREVPAPEPDLREAGAVLYDVKVEQYIIRPAVYHALKTESVNIEAALGATVPEYYWKDVASDILSTIYSSAVYASYGESPAEMLAKEGPNLERRVKEMRAVAQMRGTKDPFGYLKMFTPLGEAVNRRLEEGQREAPSGASEREGEKQQ